MNTKLTLNNFQSNASGRSVPCLPPAGVRVGSSQRAQAGEAIPAGISLSCRTDEQPDCSTVHRYGQMVQAGGANSTEEGSFTILSSEEYESC